LTNERFVGSCVSKPLEIFKFSGLLNSESGVLESALFPSKEPVLKASSIVQLLSPFPCLVLFLRVSFSYCSPSSAFPL
jgi:hypothetical protein